MTTLTKKIKSFKHIYNSINHGESVVDVSLAPIRMTITDKFGAKEEFELEHNDLVNYIDKYILKAYETHPNYTKS